ncbi:MAG: Rrf2 family transcriptional regulator [Lachnospiraceae bacterium]|nr:Rrf2 family transcriptional regulator [Lachnospiraceae bacterium]
MKISTRGRYSLRMMIDLAQHYNDGFIALKDISERQDISKKYLEQIIPFLNRSNLLLANKGHMGGYKLAKAPSEITVRDIVESAEGSLTPVSCMDNSPNLCEKCSECITLPIYQGLYDVVNKYFESITLEDIITRQISEFTYNI